MNSNKKENIAFTLAVFSENTVGILNLISIVFSRRGINVESISASATVIPGITKTTILAFSDRDTMEKVVAQIEKAIFVVKAFLFVDDEIIHQEVALYKVPTEKLIGEEYLEKIIRTYNARILDITAEYTVIEKTGHTDETEALFNELKKYDILQFVRSGRVCVTKDPVEHVTEYLKMREEQKNNLKNQ